VIQILKLTSVITTLLDQLAAGQLAGLEVLCDDNQPGHAWVCLTTPSEPDCCWRTALREQGGSPYLLNVFDQQVLDIIEDYSWAYAPAWWAGDSCTCRISHDYTCIPPRLDGAAY